MNDSPEMRSPEFPKERSSRCFPRRRDIFSSCLFLLMVLSSAAAIADPPSSPQDTSRAKPWKFVSLPDFMNADATYPCPNWEDVLDYVLKAVKAENPDFLIVAGDTVSGHWYVRHDLNYLQEQADIYWTAWMKRMEDHGIKVYVSVGDHELGDNPWTSEVKQRFFPHFEEAFRKHFKMPTNGPANMKGLAFSVSHKRTLFVFVDPFEQQPDGSVNVSVSGEQLAWVERTLQENADAEHIVVVGHIPILPGYKKRRTSDISLPGGRDTPLWQLMKKHHVDLYLAGEVHDVSVQSKDGLVQIITGSTPTHLPDFSYTLATVHPDRIELEIKRLDFEHVLPDMENLSPQAKADLDRIRKVRPKQGEQEAFRHWLDSENLSPQVKADLQQIEKVTPQYEEAEKLRYWLKKRKFVLTRQAREKGFVTIGTMTIDKSGPEKQLKNPTGCFGGQ